GGRGPRARRPAVGARRPPPRRAPGGRLRAPAARARRVRREPGGGRGARSPGRDPGRQEEAAPRPVAADGSAPRGRAAGRRGGPSGRRPLRGRAALPGAGAHVAVVVVGPIRRAEPPRRRRTPTGAGGRMTYEAIG